MMEIFKPLAFQFGVLDSDPLETAAANAEPLELATRSAFWTDWLGVIASIGCAIHCAAMPFVVTFLPMLGFSFLADELFHKFMVFVCLLLAVIAFVPGWRRHRRWLPLAIASVGISFIATAAFALENSCCVSCVATQDKPIEASIAATDLSSIEAVTGEIVCTNACCELCANESADGSQIESTTAVPSTLPATFLSLITPLGGLLLVTAHLTNRRFSCRRGCCPAEAAHEGEAK